MRGELQGDVFPDEIRVLTGPPTIAVLAEQRIDWSGVRAMAEWVKEHRPACLPENWDGDGLKLFPHMGLRYPDAPVPEDVCSVQSLTANELLVELAGRKCYDSFGAAAGRKTNEEYIAHIMGGVDKTPGEIARELLKADVTLANPEMRRKAVEAVEAAIRAERDRVPHASVLYHAKMTFFFAGLSRRVSQELMRNYVGSDRDHEGAPSQESTRFTVHYGTFVAPPYVEVDSGRLLAFQEACKVSYRDYRKFIEDEVYCFEREHGRPPKGLERKRILEAAIGLMPWSFETSFIWTTNPGALTKLLVERDNPLADAEFQRFARALKLVCVKRWPNLFPRFVSELRAEGVIS